MLLGILLSDKTRLRIVDLSLLFAEIETRLYSMEEWQLLVVYRKPIFCALWFLLFGIRAEEWHKVLGYS